MRESGWVTGRVKGNRWSVLECEECAVISETAEGWVAFVVSEEQRAVEFGCRGVLHGATGR
jgi:hypothetical protein